MEHWYFTHYLRLDSPEVEPEIQSPTRMTYWEVTRGMGREVREQGNALNGCGREWLKWWALGSKPGEEGNEEERLWTNLYSVAVAPNGTRDAWLENRGWGQRVGCLYLRWWRRTSLIMTRPMMWVLSGAQQDSGGEDKVTETTWTTRTDTETICTVTEIALGRLTKSQNWNVKG